MTKSDDRFVLCVANGKYKASLDPRKIYRVIDDPEGEKRAMIRVVDESGEDYLFPADLFVPIDVPSEAQLAFEAEASHSG